MDDALNTMRFLYFLFFLSLVVISFFILITLIRLRKNNEEITSLFEANNELLTELHNKIESQNTTIADQKMYNHVQFDQWFYDHCYMNNLGPHDWVATGKHSGTDYQFICRKCGQTINVPKMLYPEHPHSLELKRKAKR